MDHVSKLMIKTIITLIFIIFIKTVIRIFAINTTTCLTLVDDERATFT